MSAYKRVHKSNTTYLQCHVRGHGLKVLSRQEAGEQCKSIEVKVEVSHAITHLLKPYVNDSEMVVMVSCPLLQLIESTFQVIFLALVLLHLALNRIFLEAL